MIRLAIMQDFSFVYNLYMHPQVNPYLLYEWMDEETFRPIFIGLVQQEVKYIYGNAIQSIGMFKLIPLQHRNHHIAYLGGLAILPGLSGKGEGSRMMKDILAFAGLKGFLRVELSVAAGNHRAIQLYEKAGFRQEGVLRKFTHLKSKDQFIDEIMMSCLL